MCHICVPKITSITHYCNVMSFLLFGDKSRSRGDSSLLSTITQKYLKFFVICYASQNGTCKSCNDLDGP